MSESRTLYVAVKGKAVPWEVPIRDLKPTEVRIKVHCVGINPIDWKTIENNLADGAGQGCDFSGVVIAVGSDVKSLKQGDTVAGGIAGGDVDNTENGAFTNILTVDEKYLFTFPHTLSESEHAWHIPEGIPITFEQAASLGIAADTSAVAVGLKFPKLDSNGRSDEWALIYGVTSSTGYICAQYARNLGYNVIGISTPNPQVVDTLGIESLDRNDPDWPKLAEKLSNGNITFALDAITIDPVDKIFSTLTTKQPAVLATLNPGADIPESLTKTKPNVEVNRVLYFNLFQEVKKFGATALPKNPEVFNNSEKLIGHVKKMLSKNQIRTLPITVVHGLDKIDKALDLQKSAKCMKIVVKL